MATKKTFGDLTLEALRENNLVKTILKLGVGVSFKRNELFAARGKSFIGKFTESGEFSINLDGKYSSDEVAFAVSSVLMYFVNYSEDNKSLLKERATVLLAVATTYNRLKFREIPRSWDSVGKVLLSGAENLKSVDSCVDFLTNNPEMQSLIPVFNFSVNDVPLNEVYTISVEKEAERSWRVVSFKGNRVKKAYAEAIRHLIKSSLEKKKDDGMNIYLTGDEKKDRNIKNFQEALTFINIHYPLLASLTSQFKFVVDREIAKVFEIDYAAVFYNDKKIVINPSDSFTIENYKFLIAHEIFHVALKHNSRRGNRDPLMWNLACDFVINRWLMQMGLGVPPVNLFMDKDLQNLDADLIYLELEKDVKLLKSMGTLRNESAGKSFKKKSKNNLFATDPNKKSLDMVDLDEQFGFASFEEACAHLLLEGVFLQTDYKGCGVSRGTLPADMVEEIRMINQPAIPWNVELASWFMKHFPIDSKKRTFARMSRRQCTTPDIPRPSYVKRQKSGRTKTFGVVIDTSGSMTKDVIGKCLGVIHSYSLASNVDEVRLVYCDVVPYDVGFISVESLKNRVEVQGRGGTYLQPAVNLLLSDAEFPDDAPILILTDGFFEETLEVRRKHAFVTTNKVLLIGRKNAMCEIFQFS